MGLRFQRRIQLLPGVRINLSRSGVGLSVGARGAHFGIDARGRRYSSVSVPGTGVSWRAYGYKTSAQRCDLCAPGHTHIPAVPVILLVVIAAAALLLWMAR